LHSDKQVEDSRQSPRPVQRLRLEKLLRGLAERWAKASQITDQRLAVIERQLAELDAQHAERLEQLQTARQSQLVATITDWDEQRNIQWDRAEGRGYRCTAKARHGEHQIKLAVKSEIEQIKVAADQQHAELERQCQNLVEASKKKCEELRVSFVKAGRLESQILQATELSLASNNLVPPSVKTETSFVKPQSAKLSLQMTESSLIEARRLSEQLQNLPLSNLISSVAAWSLWLVVFGGCTVLVHFLAPLNWVLAFSISAGVTCLLILGSLLGVRPWLRRAVEDLYPQLQGHLGLASRYRRIGEELADSEREAECEQLLSRFSSQRDELLTVKQSQIEAINQRAKAEIANVWQQARQHNCEIDSQLDVELDEVDQSFTARQEKESSESEDGLSRLAMDHQGQRQRLQEQKERVTCETEARLNRALKMAGRHLGRMQRWHGEQFLQWNQLGNSTEKWPEIKESFYLPIGNVDFESMGASEPGIQVLAANQISDGKLTAPVLFSPIEDSYLVVHGDPKKECLLRLLRTIILRTITQIPPGRSQICIIDPNGLGRDFGWLMALGDFDPGLVTHRVWTQTNHITRQLQNLVDGAEDFIQKALRNRYESIIQYNRDAAGMAEPYRLVVWCGLPAGLDDQCWKLLQSLCDSGPRCGIIPILVVDTNLEWNDSKKDWLRLRGVHLELSDEAGLALVSQRGDRMPLLGEQPPNESQTDQLITEVARRAQAASRVEVPLSQIVGLDDGSEAFLGQTGRIWYGDSSQLLEIPVGQAGVGKTQSLKLGIGTAQHAVIAGKTGSGKSSLLHAIITSAVVKYSPESLRLVLLDFKKGVEFQVYSETQIPHADIIGIESHREFGLSALQRIDECLQSRGELFRGAGVQDIAGWNRVNPDRILPRVLLIIDEFQELFIEDDKISHACSTILDRIVRQGRSFGVHAVMSSQTLAGAYSLPRSTLNQMSVRIALVCDVSDAQIIFSDDNPAASRLKHPGSAIYNDAGGRIEGNQPMQVGWVEQQTQINWFKHLPQGYRNADITTNRLGRTVVYDGNRPALWRPESVDMAIKQSLSEINRDAIWCAVGESVSINPAVVFPLTQQTGRNALMVGGDDAMGASVLTLVTHCFVKSAWQRGVRPRVLGVVGAKPGDCHTLELGDQWSSLPCELQMTQRLGAADALSELNRVLQARIAEQACNEQPVLLNLMHLGRLTSLRREEEFSFGASGETPDKWLENLLRDGPSHGIHVLIWAESYSVVNRWLPRSALRELEIRLLMQMSPSDSSNLMDSVGAAQLGDRLMLLYDEASGVEAKFRPYDFASLKKLKFWEANPPSSGGLD
jgi:S-DNA-T family DNA segregation ATPase FtsK/SpoIIIE